MMLTNLAYCYYKCISGNEDKF